jgi:peptidoglycan/xylan/chitin deacetylase (PgdA/CDA1 family)
VGRRVGVVCRPPTGPDSSPRRAKFLRAGVRRILETLIVRSGAVSVARARRRRHVLVLAYHNVVPDGASPAGDGSLHLLRDHFLRQLDLLHSWAEIVPLTELFSRPPDEARPCVAITFDDAYRGAVTIALPELRNRGLPATLFVAPGRLGGETFWWDLIGGGASLAPDVRFYALNELHGEEAPIRAWACKAGLPMHEVPELWRSATVSELEDSLYPGLSLGSHSWSHPNLAALGRAEVEQELNASRVWLRARFAGSFVPWLAFPYGLFTAQTCEAARTLEFRGALRIDGGWMQPPISEPLAVPRLNIPAGLSADGFALRISGLISR